MVLKVILSEPIFWVCMSLSAALAGFTHYIMKHYAWCVEGWRLIGRYIVGILCIGFGFAGWYADHPQANANDVIRVLVLLVVSVGLTTVLTYALDNTHAGERAEADLQESNLRTR